MVLTAALAVHRNAPFHWASTMTKQSAELARLQALDSYRILDTPAEASFDEITRLASLLLSAPSSAISLVDADRQWFKARVGIPMTQTPRSHALCSQAVAAASFLEVSDASLDQRFASSPLVNREGGIRFYAGAPLIVPSGHWLGTLCVFDTVAREPLRAEQRLALQDLANLAVDRMESRKARLQSEIAASVVAATSDAILAVGWDGLISFWNPASERMFGYDAARALGSTLDLILPEQLTNTHYRGLRLARAGGETSLVGTTMELSARRATGEEFPIELSLARWHGDGERDGGGFAAIVRDISARRALESDRANARLFLDSIVAHLPAMLFVKDSVTGRYLLFNKAGESIVGLPEAAVIGRTDEELFPDVGAEYRERDRSVLRSTGVETYESEFTRTDGCAITLRTKRIVVTAPDDRKYILGLSDDVTELRRSERHVLHLAHHDSLTGLLNRASLVERMDQLTRSGEEFVVLTIDLDRFKAVNDQFGHPIGDRLLVEAGIRLLRFASDRDIVARVGGDEFVIVAVGACERATTLADLVIAALSEPYSIGRFVAYAGASIGVVVAPRDGQTVETLRQAADLALYRAKASRRGGVCFFSSELDDEASERRMLEGDLREAIEGGEIEVAYQPVVSSVTGQVTSFEALARWTHPQRGPISPARFIGIAEESGMIGLLGTGLLLRACRAAAAWPSDIKVAVNLSPLQFESSGLVKTVKAALALSGLPPQRLQLEVTEGLLIRNVDHTFAILTELRNLGVQILLDDFGVGFSSLSYFERFPFDKVKIDQSFVAKIATSPAARAIIQAVVGLGRTLNMGVVAEGVETPEQMQALVELGCTHLQGFLFSEPQAESAFRHILRPDRDEAGVIASL
nr:EAL domain-containing protein [Sphingomonas japonica]